MAAFRAGFVGLVGRPNVGKSTLLNQVLGEKLAIATPRPQTTRNRILGVRNLAGAQLVLVDTPGLHRPSGRGRTRLNQFMVGEALAALEEVDALCALVECPGSAELKRRGGRFQLDPADRFVLGELERANKPTVLAVNKVDLLRDKRQLLPILDGWMKTRAFSAVVPISALSGDGVDGLTGELVKLLPEAPPLYPEEMLTDRAERWLAAELVREQVFLLTRQEVPYAVAVSIDEWQEKGDRNGKGAVVISATIHVEKEAQKKIVVGEGGRMVREIGTRARQEIARLVGCPVHLELFVRVDAGWTAKPGALKDLGYARE